jgi:hypothetical protein
MNFRGRVVRFYFRKNSSFYPGDTKKRRIEAFKRLAGMDFGAAEELDSPPVLRRDTCNVQAYTEGDSPCAASVASAGSVEPYRLEEEDDLEFQESLDLEGDSTPLLRTPWLRSVMKHMLCLCGFDLFASAKG